MTALEKAIERIRQDGPPWAAEDVRMLLAELDRLTTLHPASEYDGKTKVLWWWKILVISDQWLVVNLTEDEYLRGEYYWTPLPAPKEP
jgi:hypothetical protein